MDNLKEKIIILLPKDILGQQILFMVEEIHDAHPEQKIILAHLGEIYRLKDGPKFSAEAKNAIKVRLFSPFSFQIYLSLYQRESSFSSIEGIPRRSKN